MSCKVAETTCNTDNAFGSETANELTMQWFKKFCKGEASLEDKKNNGWPSRVTRNLERW